MSNFSKLMEIQYFLILQGETKLLTIDVIRMAETKMHCAVSGIKPDPT